MEEFDDILGFDPSQLNVFSEKKSTTNFNSNIYKPSIDDAKSDDGVYRATIKVIYNPYDRRQSLVERQSYYITDGNGGFEVVSSLTNNDTNCPIFKAWKTCHYSKDINLQKQALGKDKGGNGYFDKRYARYVLIQVLDDPNNPEYNFKYMFWKCPKFIWDMLVNKMNPSAESKKAAIPVMDFLFGRSIDLEITPGPDDPAHPERRKREISYSTSEISEDCVPCVNPDGSSLLTAEQQTILDKYINDMKAVWKEKDTTKRNEISAQVSTSDNTMAFRAFYPKVVETIKSFCPNLVEEMGYKPWSDEVTARVQAWIDVVLSGNDPTSPLAAAMANTAPVVPPTAEAPATPTASTGSDLPEDLPF